ncbi:hypothetical protein SODALDRAFT_320735 [Sodiomyces alkalinus F11]|uniref:Uncharacterized protein n=1 Tax=Sodiomyces alkalinus (strain CBS 110278 / VKM F-3762 / F11) TaxID=1314773 RepID=A0A3N2PLH7_SODAK|nr:hypothetical protein SODALDRAFT_320735 [Sodiomyces alkalinus F11]ROT35391.1 hypothetical protein SODALDRAFT_320735 [Sodiomyces alkalinus F11]
MSLSLEILWKLTTPSGALGDAAKVSDQGPFPHFNDRHEIHESTTPPQQHRHQRQQPRLASSIPSDLADRTPSPSSSQTPTLRRTPRFEAPPTPTPAPSSPSRRIHVEAASVGFSHGIQLATADAPQPVRAQPPAAAGTRRATADLHPALRISKHTHSAILFALEEALRHPHPFTPDLVEESASMADLMGGPGGPSSSHGNAAPSARPRPTGAPAPTGSPSGIRGPRMIMQERAAREAARQRAEQEQMQLERQRAEEEARLLEEAQRRNSQRRAAAAAGAAVGGLPGAGPPEHVHQPDPTTPQRRPAGLRTDIPSATRPMHDSSRRRGPSATQPQQQGSPPTRASASQVQQGQTAPGAAPALGTSQQQATTGAQAGQTSATPAAGASKPRNSFPHAFERWETLSAHWEGLTNFWIRRLEQNNQDIERDPINQALSRQVTDLSAAGANLFHAVVELQRLRASSERKFQRWFFETRAELERAQEVNAMLENALNEERRARAEAIREAVAKEQASSMNKTRFEEMRKELQISKEEARRAWEELGRREQEERERTISLQNGLPTIVGGVQVVPMTHGVPTRHGSSQQGGGQQSGYGPESAAAAAATAPASDEGGYYTQQHRGTDPEYAGGSEGGYGEGEYQMDVQGNFAGDQRGDKAPFEAPPSPVSDEGAEDYATPAAHPPNTGYMQAGTASPSRNQPQPQPQQQQQQQQQQQHGQYYPPQQDYSGQGYAAAGWETLPRHHHPTRLSDVIEEDDERSRTSASHSRV